MSGRHRRGKKRAHDPIQLDMPESPRPTDADDVLPINDPAPDHFEGDGAGDADESGTAVWVSGPRIGPSRDLPLHAQLEAVMGNLECFAPLLRIRSDIPQDNIDRECGVPGAHALC